MKKLIALLTIFVSVHLFSSVGQTGIPKAQSMFIYNFTRLIEWPAAYKQGEFVIGVYGNSTVYNELESFTASKKAGTQTIRIERYKDPSEIGKSHIVFVSYAKTKETPQIKSQIAGQPTLIITEKRGGTDEGAAINFVIEANKLKFELKPSNATEQGLTISNSLSNMATLVD